jgi:uncharacterized membrane protein YccF (DUF307 family)
MSSQRQVITFEHDRRGVLSWVLNLIWLLIGGWHMFLTWFVVGALICCTIIGIPCGWQVMKISFFMLFPFGKTIVYTHEEFFGTNESGARCCFRGCNCVMNVVWAITVGWMLALEALLTGVLLMLTIIGIPFGWQCFKLTYICFCPFGVDFSALETETMVINTPTTTYKTETGV